MTRILFVGQKPETVDFSDPSLPPGFSAEKISAGIALGVSKIEDRGWQGDTCMTTPDAAGRKRFRGTLLGLDGKDVLFESGGAKMTFAFRNIAEAKLVLTDKLIEEDLKARKRAS